MPNPTETTQDTDDFQPPRLRLMAAAVAVILAAVGLFALFGGSSDEPDRPAGTAGLAHVDGTLTVVEEDRLVLTAFQPLNGRSEVSFVIRPEDQGNFDIAHLQSHSSVAIPARIFYRQEGGTLFAVYKEDAPANSQTP